MRTFWKFDEIPSAWFPSRRSEAMATHSLPTMAITEPPLYSIIDYHGMSFGPLEAINEKRTDHVGQTLRMRGTGGRGDGGTRVSEAAQAALLARNAYAPDASVRHAMSHSTHHAFKALPRASVNA